jgi:hypothetical protein
VKDYAAIQLAERTARRDRAMRRYVSEGERKYLEREGLDAKRFHGVNQRQRRKRARQVGHR